MRVDFLGHATLLVRHGKRTILTDPWWTGPAYDKQWYPFPIPVPERYDLSKLDAVYISHAHEDHLHRGTLVEVLKTAPNVQAIIPKRYDSQMRDYLRRIGFRRIREVPSGTSLTLGKDRDRLRLTVITHMDDSMLAVAAGDQVLLNANDALHASPRELIEVYCRYLRRRLPHIDYLFCGFGGASYFPNCFRVPGKDDLATAAAREQFFHKNVALVAEQLKPRHVFPFAAHFVLIDERMWWISQRRLTMEPPGVTLRRLSPATSAAFHDLQPGDYVEAGQVYASAYPEFDPDEVRCAVHAHYAAHDGPKPLLQSEQFEALVNEVRATVARHVAPADLDAVIKLWDYPAAVIRVRAHQGESTVTVIAPDEAAADLALETRSDLIIKTMHSPFGRDLITIGYGALVHLRTSDVAASNAHERLLDMLAPPRLRWRERLRKHPLRTIGFVLGDASMRYEAKERIRQRLGARQRTSSGVEPALYAIGDWSRLATVPE